MKKIGHWLLIDGAMVLEDSTLYNLLSVAVIPTFIHLEKQVRLNGINELATIVCRSLPAQYRALQVCALATWQRSLRWLQAF